jgi:hypothetical protein
MNTGKTDAGVEWGRLVAPATALCVVWYLLLLLAPWDVRRDGAVELLQGQGGGILSLLTFFSGDNLSASHTLSGLHALLGILSALAALALLAALAAGTRQRRAGAAVRPLAFLLVGLTTAHLVQAARLAPDVYALGVAAWAALALSVLVASATLASARPS